MNQLLSVSLVFCFFFQPNIMVFIAELFWWFENVRPDFVQPRDVQELKDGERPAAGDRQPSPPRVSRTQRCPSERFTQWPFCLGGSFWDWRPVSCLSCLSGSSTWSSAGTPGAFSAARPWAAGPEAQGGRGRRLRGRGCSHTPVHVLESAVC